MKLILIVDDKVIMDMSKIESGQMDFKYSDVNLSDIFQNLAYTFRFKIKEGVHLSLVLPREPFILHTEKKRLIQVLSNFKYTSEGSITAGYEVDEKEVYFFVTDREKASIKKTFRTCSNVSPNSMPSYQGPAWGFRSVS